MSISSPNFQPYCPLGGTWYACGNGTKFTGCCTENPCTNNGCFAGNLKSASFNNLTAWGQFPDQVCEAGLWYTCKATNPSFLGCCTSNPCKQNGCPSSDLRSGYLSANPQIAMAFDPQPPLPESYASTSSASFSSFTTLTGAPTWTAGNAAQATTAAAVPVNTDKSSNSQPVGMIAGAAAGGFALLLVLIGAFLILRQRRESRRYPGASSQLPEKSLPVSSLSVYSPYLDDTRKLPLYSSKPGLAVLPSTVGLPVESSAHPPRYEVYEAGSREVSYVPYSPHYSQQGSSSWPSDTTSSNGARSVSGLGVRGVHGNSPYSRAELR